MAAPNKSMWHSLPQEIWKPVPSEPGVLASSHGRVLLPPTYAPVNNGGFRLYTPKPRVGVVGRAHKLAKHTYLFVMVKTRGGSVSRQVPRKVHRLVCEAFHGGPPFDGAVVLHLDEDSHNNRPENLKWGSQRENLNAPKYREAMKENLRKLSLEDAFVIREKVAGGVMQKTMADAYGVSPQTVSDIILGRTYVQAEWR